MTPEPDGDRALERQRASTETAFRERWAPLDLSKPRILTGHVYAEARKFIGQQGRTWLDQGIIQAVRDGAEPGDALPPLRPEPYLARTADAKVTLIGRVRDGAWRSCSLWRTSPGPSLVTASSRILWPETRRPCGSWSRSRPAPCTA
jgi:hypothetical protein